MWGFTDADTGSIDIFYGNMSIHLILILLLGNWGYQA